MTIALVALINLVSCQSVSHAPPVTMAMVNGTAGQQADLATLREGRSLFVSRCIECHTLPSVSAHTASDWPRLIDEMADRADLKQEQRKAVLAYILAVRTQAR